MRSRWENDAEYTSGEKSSQMCEKHHWLHADPMTSIISKQEKYKANVNNTHNHQMAECKHKERNLKFNQREERQIT